ncbi:MAG: aminoacyl-histidine dipeptidase [Lachnospiraceae bacterium]|nr:aminoacyl-histidine dipeptidase [Lachnospiraceae bacterium]
MGKLSGLEPEKVFDYFEEICAIPRGSGNTEAISSYLADFAKKRNLEHFKDSLNNVFIRVPATKGYEESPSVLLQGHMDMVCEKTSQSRHDFQKDPIDVDHMDNEIFARGTTLGADDGIALAYILAIIDSGEDCPHPELECLFTSDEETGMNGVKGFDFTNVKARNVINLDSEDEGVVYVSCAGGLRGTLRIPVKRFDMSGIVYNVVISGLHGGHSGDMIDRYFANAIIIMGRLLHFLTTRTSFHIFKLQGGLMDNAIPREANCRLIVSPAHSKDFEKLIEEFEGTIKNEFSANEKNMMIYCESLGESTENVIKPRLQNRMIFLMNTVPDGVQNMCMDEQQKGLVKTSLNFGIMRLRDDHFTLEASLRSSVSSEKYALSDKLKFLAEGIGGTYEVKGDYPAWEFNENSKLMKLSSDVYKDLFGYHPVIKGIHAGLECGVIYHALKPVDVISFGPQINGAHTPKEKLSITSVQKTWDFLLRMLKELK